MLKIAADHIDEPDNESVVRRSLSLACSNWVFETSARMKIMQALFLRIFYHKEGSVSFEDDLVLRQRFTSSYLPGFLLSCIVSHAFVGTKFAREPVVYALFCLHFATAGATDFTILCLQRWVSHVPKEPLPSLSDAMLNLREAGMHRMPRLGARHSRDAPEAIAISEQFEALLSCGCLRFEVVLSACLSYNYLLMGWHGITSLFCTATIT